jgi:hypothetical protein
MIDIDQAIQVDIAADVIQNRKARNLRAQKVEQPKIREVEPEGRYTISIATARENNRALRELDELEQKVLEKAAVIGVIKKLRESSYLEFAQLPEVPKLTTVPATIPATDGDTFLTRTYPKLSESEERALDQAFAYVEGFKQYAELNPVDDLLNKDKLTNAEFERIHTHRRYCDTAEKAMKLISKLSAKKYSGVA